MIKRSGDLGLLHEVVEHAGVLYLAGAVSDDLSLGMYGQTKDVLRQIDELLAANGSSKERLLTALIFITDMKLKPEMNQAWKEWVPAGQAPTRATIGIADLSERVLIEVVVTAAKG